jgi:YHS domain-containing protein
MQSIKQFFSALFVLLALSTNALAGKDLVYTSYFSNNGAGGYDVTAYFSENKAVEGSKQYSTEYAGADWLFASQANLDKFLAAPDTYAPQYGGYCAWAASQGYTASGDPEQWSIHGDKLYLNYDKTIKDRWEGDKETF